MRVCELDLCFSELDRWKVVINRVMKFPISIKGEKLLGR